MEDQAGDFLKQLAAKRELVQILVCLFLIRVFVKTRRSKQQS